jgi:hypothetical protein
MPRPRASPTPPGELPSAKVQQLSITTHTAAMPRGDAMTGNLSRSAAADPCGARVVGDPTHSKVVTANTPEHDPLVAKATPVFRARLPGPARPQTLGG